MNIRFDPVPLLTVKDKLRFCDFCSQASLSDTVHESPSCILGDFSFLNDGSDNQIKNLNFEYYQCIFRNCTVQLSDFQDFSFHLSNHGILLDHTKSSSSQDNQTCSDESTQQQLLVDSERTTSDDNVIVDSEEKNSEIEQQCDVKTRDFGGREKRKRQKTTASCVSELSASASTLECTDLLQPIKSEIELPQELDCAPMFHIKSEVDENIIADDSNCRTEDLVCEMCSYAAENSSALENHRQSHLKSVAKLAALNAHKQQTIANKANSLLSSVGVKEDSELLKCTECSYKTGNKHVLDLHLKLCIRSKKRSDAMAKQQKNRVFQKRVIRSKAKANCRNFSCGLCSFVGKCKGSVKIHKISAHSKPKQTKEHSILRESQVQSCPNCPYKPNNARTMKVHLQMCGQNLKKKIFRCPKCFYLTRFKSNLTIHEKQKCHKARAKPKFPVKSTGVVTSPIQSLGTNNCKVSSKNESLYCQKCPYRTSTKLQFARHLSICGHLMHNKRHYAMHIRNCKSNVMNAMKLSCQQCPYKAPNRRSLAIHSSLCGKIEYSAGRCQNCNFISLNSKGLSNHKRSCKLARKPVEVDQPSSSEGNHKGFGTFHQLKINQSCPFCPFTSKFKFIRQKHILLCRDRNDKSKPVLACKHSNCFFLSRSVRGMNAHRRVSHPEVMLGNSSSTTSTDILRCPLCPYVNRTKIYLERHVELCRQWKNGCERIITCGHSDCFFLTETERGLHIHNCAKHHSQMPPKISNLVHSAINEHKTDSLSDKENTPSAIEPQKKKRHLCGRCPYSTNESEAIRSHRARCALMEGGASRIIKCSFQDCHFLADSIGAYKSHYIKKHNVRIIQKNLETECSGILNDDASQSFSKSGNEHYDKLPSFNGTTIKKEKDILPFHNTGSVSSAAHNGNDQTDASEECQHLTSKSSKVGYLNICLDSGRQLDFQKIDDAPKRLNNNMLDIERCSEIGAAASNSLNPSEENTLASDSTFATPVLADKISPQHQGDGIFSTDTLDDLSIRLDSEYFL